MDNGHAVIRIEFNGPHLCVQFEHLDITPVLTGSCEVIALAARHLDKSSPVTRNIYAALLNSKRHKSSSAITFHQQSIQGIIPPNGNVGTKIIAIHEYIEVTVSIEVIGNHSIYN